MDNKFWVDPRECGSCLCYGDTRIVYLLDSVDTKTVLDTLKKVEEAIREDERNQT